MGKEVASLGKEGPWETQAGFGVKKCFRCVTNALHGTVAHHPPPRHPRGDRGLTILGEDVNALSLFKSNLSLPGSIRAVAEATLPICFPGRASCLVLWVCPARGCPQRQQQVLVRRRSGQWPPHHTCGRWEGKCWYLVYWLTKKKLPPLHQLGQRSKETHHRLAS